jgi:DNA invertase Pin-like site-specific DNA recombinase
VENQGSQVKLEGTAYSYVRFSTSKQELGDSLRRQVEMAEAYCLKTGLTLAEKSYRDLGVSGFRRKNIESGALAAFIEAVKTGKVERGSYLIIEQFDRLSRSDVNVALRLLLDLVDSGVNVVTLVDEKIWDKAAVKDIGNLILAIVFMSRANNESEAKAARLSHVWGQKKLRAADGTATKIVTSECPRWLKATDDKSGFIILEDKVESIRKVFEMRISGFGMVAIVRRANEEKWPVPGKGPVRQAAEEAEVFEARKSVGTWHTSLVGRILQNRALLGEYQPFKCTGEGREKLPSGDPIPNYYPAVLDESTFMRAQAKADRSGQFPGRRDVNMKNWLQGLLRCQCGQSFVRKNKQSHKQMGYARYYCTNRHRGVSECASADAKQLEGAVLEVVSYKAPAYFQMSTRSEDLKAKADMLEVDISAAKQTRDRFVDAIANASAAVPILVQRFEAEAAKVEALTAELSLVRGELADITADPDTVFANIVAAIKNADSVDERAKLKEELSRVIERIVVYEPDGFIQVFLRGSDCPIVQPLRPTTVIPGLTYITEGGELA